MVNSFHQGQHTAISCSASSNGCRQVVALVAGSCLPCFSHDSEMFLHKFGHTFESPKGLVKRVPSLSLGSKRRASPWKCGRWPGFQSTNSSDVDQVVKSSNHSQGAQGLGKDSWGSKSLEWICSGKNAKVLETKNFTSIFLLPFFGSAARIFNPRMFWHGHCCFCSSVRTLCPAIYDCSRT